MPAHVAMGETGMKLAYITSDVPGRMNALLAAFADRASDNGLRPIGAVQLNRTDDDGALCRTDLRLLPDGPVVCISQQLGRASTGCTLDPGALENAVDRIARMMAGGADVLIVNKFGSHEADGHGFRELIGAALGENIPVLCAVAPAHLPAFMEFSGGLATALPCDLEPLDAWLSDEPAP